MIITFGHEFECSWLIPPHKKTKTNKHLFLFHLRSVGCYVTLMVEKDLTWLTLHSFFFQIILFFYPLYIASFAKLEVIISLGSWVILLQLCICEHVGASCSDTCTGWSQYLHIMWVCPLGGMNHTKIYKNYSQRKVPCFTVALIEWQKMGVTLFWKMQL